MAVVDVVLTVAVQELEAGMTTLLRVRLVVVRPLDPPQVFKPPRPEKSST